VIKVLKWPIIFGISVFGALFIWAFIYNLLGNDLNNFSDIFNNYYVYLIIGISLIFIPLLIRAYKKNELKESRLKDLFFIIILGISLSLFYNTLIFNLNKIYNFTNLYEGSVNTLVVLISTGLIAPIIEELMFRGIVYNELKKLFSKMKSIILCSVIFAILHFTGVQIIYAFGFSFLLIFVYEKYKTIKAPIILHMTSNITTTLFVPFLIKDYIVVNHLIQIVAIIIFGLVLYFKIYKKS